MIIAAAVALMFGALELVTRRVLFRSSKDLSRFASYPGRATALMTGPGPHIVFVGNSITEHGIDPDEVARELGGKADAFTADSSHINTWYWMINAELWRQHLEPELVVVTFHGGSLSDGQRLEIGRLAQFFTTRADWGELFAEDLTTLDDRAEFLASSAWSTFAVADRIKQRVLGLIPRYQAYAQAENRSNFDGERAVEGKPTHRSWSTLDRLLGRARQEHTRVLFVAFPTRPEDPNQAVPYEIAPEMRQRIAAAGMLFLDLRKVPELDPARHYDDDIHLNEAGRAVYTRRLVSELRQLRLE